MSHSIDTDVLLQCRLLAAYQSPDLFPCESQRLTGDASTRSYFRLKMPSGQTIVLMQMPEAFDEQNFNYLENYHLFRSLGIQLAEIYYTDPAKGYVFLQDLGDSTFYELYGQWSEPSRLEYYLRTIACLERIQEGKPQSDLAFTTEKFLWELQFFKNHFLIGLRKASLSSDDSMALDEIFLRLAAELSERPRVFCHRDYHSRNLMVQSNQLYIIDFQDARLGPVTYDLASLCYDSYIQHEQAFIARLEAAFFANHPGRDARLFEYPRMCLQRNLKALGTFGYQATRMGREFYLAFTGPTLGYLKQHFKLLPEYEGLRKLLTRYLPELQN